MIIAGHGRVDAAKLLGMKQVPTICLENRFLRRKR
jgi:ParB-like chromosome segregation protein Spo0J